MRPRFGAVLGLTLAAGLAVAGFARAEDAQTCEVPAYLLTTDSTLSKVADAIKNARPLNVLVVGSRSSTILSSEASAYPARLQAALKELAAQITEAQGRVQDSTTRVHLADCQREIELIISTKK